jgi:hypothetical protein
LAAAGLPLAFAHGYAGGMKTNKSKLIAITASILVSVAFAIRLTRPQPRYVIVSWA